MSTEHKPVNIVIGLDCVKENTREMIACGCAVLDGDDEFLNHTAIYLSHELHKAAQSHIREAMQYAARQMKKQKRSMH